MKLEIVATKKFVPSVDRTGKRLSQDEINDIESSSLVGSLDVKVWAQGIALIAFRCNVINGKNERFVALPARKTPQGEWKQTFELGDFLLEEVKRHGLRAMRQAEQLGTTLTVEIEL